MTEAAVPDRARLRRDTYLPTAYHYHETPLYLKKASGQHVWDDDGRCYLDAIGGIVCISAGHNHPRIKKRLSEALDQDVIQHTSYLYDNPGAAEATQRLLDQAPEGLERIGFVSAGSEANELALTAARHAKGNHVVAHFEHSYHGGTSGTLNLCGHGSWQFHNQATSGAVAVKVPYCYRCPFGKQPTKCGLECAKSIRETLTAATSGKIAAFIAEPILGVGGFIDPPQDFFAELQQIVRDFDGFYISDEVQTGVGRCGQSFFHSEALGIDPDCITMAKGLGNGAPIAACVGRPEFFEPMRGRVFFSTFGGDTHQTLQAAETLAIIADEELMSNAKVLGQQLKEALLQMREEVALIGDVRGSGLLLGMELVRDRKSKEHAVEETTMVMEHCKEGGLLVGKGGAKGNVLRIAPPMCIDASDVERIVQTLRESFKRVSA